MNDKFFEFSNLSDDDKTALLTQLFQLYHVIVDSKGIVRHVSDEFSQLIGYSANDMTGWTFADFLAPGCDRSFATGAVDGTSVPVLKQILLSGDGSPRVADLAVADISVSSEVFRVVTHFTIERTDPLQANRQLFEQSGIAEFLLTPGQLQIVAANHRAQILCGLSETELKQRLLSDLVELSPLQLLVALKKSPVDSGRSFNLDLTLASGEPHCVQLQLNPVQLSGTPLLHLQILSCSDHKEQVLPLQQAKDLSDSLFDSLPMAALLMDNLGVINKTNRAMAEILGKNIDDLIGQRARRALPQQLTALISAMRSSSHTQSLRINNQAVAVIFKQQPIRDSKNQSLGLLLTIEPVTTTRLPLRLKALEIANEMAV